MNWQFSNDMPIYSQLISQVKFGIVSGQMIPGERMAAVRDMAAEAGVNPNTMQRALQELEREGLVFTQRNSGRFVTEDMTVIDSVKMALAKEQISKFMDAMSRLGYGREEIIGLLSSSEGEEIKQ